MPLVLDTSTAISGLLWHGLPGKLIDAIQAKRVELYTSAPLLAELQGVLARAKFAKQLRARSLSGEGVLEGYAAIASIVVPSQEMILEWIEGGVLECPFALAEEVAQVRELWKKYADVPMSLADACLVRMIEKHDHHQVCTLNRDLTVYRKRGHDPIPLIIPLAA